MTTPRQHDPCPADAVRAARAVADALGAALGDDLFAMYLHGSAVLGGFRWDRSDLDVLALSRGALSDPQVHRVGEALRSPGYPANGLELSLMTADEAAAPALPAPRFQLHVTTIGRDRAGKTVDGRVREGDRDLVLHLGVCRAHGLAVVGPPPSSTLGPVPDAVLLAAMRDEIAWARLHAPLEYLVLTCARAWLFAETGRIASKIGAGTWASARGPDHAVIHAAVARQRGEPTELSVEAAQRFADAVGRLLTARRPPSAA